MTERKERRKGGGDQQRRREGKEQGSKTSERQTQHQQQHNNNNNPKQQPNNSINNYPSMEHSQPQQQQQHQQTSKEPAHHQQEEEVIFQRKRRTGWRHCALCQGPETDGLEASADPMLHVCACPSRGVVHYSCQGRAMAASGLIACPVCGASYAETNSGRGGVRFHATPKSLLDYVRDDPGARASLATLASMLLSALLALVTLWRTLTVDWAAVIGPEVAAGLQLPLSKEGLKADLRVLLLVNGKFVMVSGGG